MYMQVQQVLMAQEYLSDMAGFVQDQFVGTAPDASYYLFLTEDDW